MKSPVYLADSADDAEEILVVRCGGWSDRGGNYVPSSRTSMIAREVGLAFSVLAAASVVAAEACSARISLDRAGAESLSRDAIVVIFWRRFLRCRA